MNKTQWEELNDAYNKLWDEYHKAVTIPMLDFIVRIINKFK